MDSTTPMDPMPVAVEDKRTANPIRLPRPIPQGRFRTPQIAGPLRMGVIGDGGADVHTVTMSDGTVYVVDRQGTYRRLSR